MHQAGPGWKKIARAWWIYVTFRGTIAHAGQMGAMRREDAIAIGVYDFSLP